MTRDSFVLTGGTPLSGKIRPQGAKNEALQILCAPLLTSEAVTIHNVPDILDVDRLLQLLRGLNVKVEQLEAGSYRLQADDVNLEYAGSPEFRKDAQRIRGSVMLIGPLLARFGQASLPQPGGDKIGRRRLDTHFRGLIELGANFRYDADRAQYYVEAEQLRGKFILMDEISVTGTANMLMAAVLAEGTTKIYNAACEPYLQQLSRLLVSMGAQIEGLGSNLLTIHGVSELGGATHRIQPDMIEIGSFIALAATTRSDITITDTRDADLGIIPRIVEKMGVQLDIQEDHIHIPAQDYEINTFIDGSILTIYDAPWPGLSPDLLSALLVMATQAKGSVLIHQKMFESRLFFVDKLIDMGARIILCDPHRATVIGSGRTAPLRGIEMTSPDIRAGVALLIAALSAKGQSTIHNINQIDRGYENIEARLKALGAQIERV